MTTKIKKQLILCVVAHAKNPVSPGCRDWGIVVQGQHRQNVCETLSLPKTLSVVVHACHPT
jgi:hypothetical protein